MRRSLLPLPLALAGLATFGCDSGEGPPPFNAGRAVFDTSPLSVTTFLTDAQTRRRVLGMPFGEAAARLGSLSFTAESDMVFSRGGDDLEQRDRFEASQDDTGNFRVFLSTPDDRVELSLVGSDLYVRQGKGHTRKKPRREVEADAWSELAFASLRQTLELFRPRLAFSNETADGVGERGAIRYDLSLSPTDNDALPSLPAAPGLAVGAPSRWRELKRPLDVTGQLWIDSQTGVPLRLKLEGRIEILDRDVRPTQLRVSYRAEVKNAGAVAPITAPAESIAELQRTVPPRDLLSFFREHLPVEASGPAPAPAPAPQP